MTKKQKKKKETMNYFYEPVTISIPEQDLRNILDCLESGLESSQELLIQHDVNFGRTTKKNKMLANILESEIERTKSSITLLKNSIGAAEQIIKNYKKQ